MILIGGGILLLLGNLGVIDVPSWSTLLRFWPVLLIAMGVDLVFGRSSVAGVFSGVLAIALLVVLGLVGFRLFAPASWQTRQETVSVALEGAILAEINATCDGCELDISDQAAGGDLISGRIEVPQLSTLRQSIAQQADVRSVELESRLVRWLPWRLDSSDIARWELALSPAPRLDLSATSRGDLAAHLSDLQIRSANLTSTDGDVRLEVAETDRAEYSVSCDDLIVILPEGLSLRIESGLSASLVTGEGLLQSGSRIASSSSAASDAQAALVVREAHTVTVLLEARSDDLLTPSEAP